MKVALIGASGNGGSRILAELSGRGHKVTSVARDPSKIAVLPHVAAQKATSSTSRVSSSCSRDTTP